MMTTKILFYILCCICIACTKNDAPQAGNQPQKTVIVGSKNFTENIILAHLIADVIEYDTDIKVIRKTNLGGTSLAWKALMHDQIDVYPEYTDTIFLDCYHQTTNQDQDMLSTIDHLLEQDKSIFGSCFGFGNTYVVTVHQELARTYQLTKISDLLQLTGKLTCGCGFEFAERIDGLPGLMQAYNLKFKKIKHMNQGFSYRALTAQHIDVAIFSETDAQLNNLDVCILEDDCNFFPRYLPGILAKNRIIQQYPELKRSFAKLAGTITAEEMRKMNALVERDGFKAQTVANNFLQEHGIIQISSSL